MIKITIFLVQSVSKVSSCMHPEIKKKSQRSSISHNTGFSKISGEGLIHWKSFQQNINWLAPLIDNQVNRWHPDYNKGQHWRVGINNGQYHQVGLICFPHLPRCICRAANDPWLGRHREDLGLGQELVEVSYLQQCFIPLNMFGWLPAAVGSGWFSKLDIMNQLYKLNCVSFTSSESNKMAVWYHRPGPLKLP